MGTFANPTVLPASMQDYLQTTAVNLQEWFTWVPPISANTEFDTRFLKFASATAGYATTLKIYLLSATPHSPVQMGDLTLITLANLGISGADLGNGYGYELGALVGFEVIPGQTYYIEVSSRDGVTLGELGLNWGPYSPTALGGCDSCVQMGSRRWAGLG